VRSMAPDMLYPLERTARWRDLLPPPVYELYAEALSVEKQSPRACTTLVGVTLEAVCQVEQAKGTSLSEQLNDLVTSGRIPATIGEMAQHLRYLRNIGVHVTHEKVTEEDIPVLLEVLEAILEYLYVFPATMHALQTRVETKGTI